MAVDNGPGDFGYLPPIFEHREQQVAAITAERDHYERRLERIERLMRAGRFDPLAYTAEVEFTVGARWGLDLALLILRGERP